MTGIEASGPNAQQIEYWNGAPGGRWVQYQEALDAQISGFGRIALDELGPRAGERILDVGCGCGQSTIDIAGRVGPAGAVTGIDISSVMLAHAGERARTAGVSNIEFVNADAAAHDLEPGAYDAVYSRFGVMFFADTEAAFTNLLGSLKAGGRIAFACWQPLAVNPWAALPLKALKTVIDVPAPPDPPPPGPFALADPARVEAILEAAGFEDIRGCGAAHEVVIGGAGDLAQIVDFVINFGPAGRLLAEASDDTKKRAALAIRQELEPHHADQHLRLDAAAWIFTARRPGGAG